MSACAPTRVAIAVPSGTPQAPTGNFLAGAIFSPLPAAGNSGQGAVPLQVIRRLGIDIDRVNVNAGSIALGHPLGATGAMLLGSVLDELERRDQCTSLITLCIAGGQGIATVIERV